MLADPDLSTGRLPLPNTLNIQTAVPESVNRGKTHSWNVAFERRLPLVSLDVAYVGNRVRGALSKVNVNPVLHMGAGQVDRPYFISHGRQLPISIFTPYGKTDYDALQVGVTRPLTRGLLLKGHYTFASTWSLGTLSNNVAVPNYELPTAEAQDRNWNPSSGSRRHTATMSFVYQLPWRSDGTPFSVMRAIVNDWQVNGIFQAFSGAPFTVTADGTALNTPGNTQTADFSGTLTKIGEIGANGLYYDPAAFDAAGGGPLRHLPAQPVPRSRRLESRLLGVPRLPDHRQAQGRAPHGRLQHHQHDEVRQPDEQHHERGFHAHLRPEQRIRSAAGQVRASVQLLRQAGTHGGRSSSRHTTRRREACRRRCGSLSDLGGYRKGFNH